MDYTIEKTLRLTNIALLISGVRVYHSDSKFWINLINFIFYFNFVWLYTDVVGEFYWLIEGIQIGKSFSELTYIAPCATICLLGTAKTLPMFYYRNVVGKIIEKFSENQPKFEENDSKLENQFTNISEEDIKTIENQKEEIEKGKEIVKDSVKFVTVVILLLYYTSIIVVIVFTTVPLLAMAYEYYNEGETDLKFPFLIKYFFDPFTKSRWPFIYMHQVWSTCIAAVNVFGADTFIYACCTYAQMHFSILSSQFEGITCESAEETRRRLTVLVRRHQELIELVNLVEIVFSKSILFNIITSSVLICLSGFNVTILDDLGEVFAFCTFLIMSLSQISMLCFFGDMLMRSSTKVSEAVYKCDWYNMDQGTKKSVLLIIIRAQKPCKLTAANFADLNLSAFTTILSRSWSYFALLRTMYK